MSEPLLTARQIAELLGFSPATIVDWAESGKIPHFKIGRALRFRESEVVGDWLEARHVTPSDTKSVTCTDLDRVA